MILATASNLNPANAMTAARFFTLPVFLWALEHDEHQIADADAIPFWARRNDRLRVVRRGGAGGTQARISSYSTDGIRDRVP